MIWALVSVAGFLFIVVAILGAYVVQTLPRVDDQSTRLTAGLCAQIQTADAAYQRETDLAKSGPVADRATHAASAERIKRSNDFIRPLVKCKGTMQEAVRSP